VQYEAAESLRKSELQYKELIEHALDGIFMADTSGRYIEVNPSGCAMLGYSRDEILAMRIPDIIAPGDLASSPLRLTELERGTNILSERRLICKDGSLLLVEIHGHMLPDGRFQSIVRDISERKKIEEALRESEDKFKYIFDHSVIGKSITLPSGEINVNQAFCEMLGYSQIEIQNHKWQDISHPDDMEITQDAINLLLSGKQDSIHFNKRYFHKNGKIIWTELATALRRGKNGEPLYFMTSILDITERKHAEELIHKRNQMLLALQNVALDLGIELDLPVLLKTILEHALALLDADRGGGIYLYDAGEQSLRLAQGSGINQGREGAIVKMDLGVAGNVFQSSQPLVVDDYTHWEKRITVLVADPPSTVMGVPLFLKGQTIGVLTLIANSQLRKFNDDDVNQASMFAAQAAIAIQNAQMYQQAQNDIAERKQTEQKLAHTLSELERSNKELEQFAYVASHDLQEPLRMVSSYTQLLARHYQGQMDDKARMYIDYAVDGAVRMQQLINDLLNFSRVNTRGISPEPVDMQALLNDVVRNLSIVIQENDACITNDALPIIRGDSSQMRQLLQNLIANALKFHRAEPPQIHFLATEMGSEWRFAIQDNGIGIDPQYADKIFIIFQRLHSRQEYPGTGIGLAVCKRIVERHGGKIWFESEPGQGSIFYFTLPK
jgi:PAS domain S-box-containing protein